MHFVALGTPSSTSVGQHQFARAKHPDRGFIPATAGATERKGFSPFPEPPMKLVLPVADIERPLR